MGHTFRKKESIPHASSRTAGVAACGSPKGVTFLSSDNGKAFRSAFVFLSLLGLFYGFVHRPDNNHPILTWHLAIQTQMSAWVLRLLGYPAEANGTWLRSDQFEALIARGCGAIEPLVTFAAAVISIPLRPLWRKVVGLVAGSVVLLFANLLRIIFLAIVGIHWPRVYRETHDQVLQAIFIVLVFVVWAGWLQWASRSRTGAVPACQ